MSTLVTYPGLTKCGMNTTRKKNRSLNIFIALFFLLTIITSVTIYREYISPHTTLLSPLSTTLKSLNPLSNSSLSPFNENVGSPNFEFQPQQDDDDQDPVPPPPIKCENIGDQADQCAFVKSYCQTSSLLNYLQFRYCTLSGYKVGGTLICVILFAIILIILLKSLGAAADVAFVPSLELIAGELKMSDVVAGLVLISVGNSAPDIFASISSVKKGAASGDLGFTIGSLSGANLCIGCLILGLAIITAYKAKPSSTRISKGQFVRSMIGLAMCCLPAIALTAKRVLRWWDAAILIVLYVVYVTFNVIYLQRQEAKKQKAALEKRKKIYIESTSSHQVEKASKSLKENLLDLDDGRFDTADGPVNGNRLHVYQSSDDLQVITMTSEEETRLETQIQTGQTRHFSLRNLIAMSTRNLLSADDDDDDDCNEENDIAQQKGQNILTASQGVEFDSEGNSIQQSGPYNGLELPPDGNENGNGGNGGNDDNGDEDDYDQTYFMEGLMTDPNWSKPGRTFVQNWVKGLPDKLLWLLALPLMFLRWISVPSCHHRPDYFRGPKKIAFHASFFFTPLVFGLAFIGIDDLNDVKYIWFGIFGASILFVICLNIFYFKIVAPTVIEYNIKRKEVQEIVANKKEEDYLDEYELKKISELMLQYNIDQDDEHAKPTVMKIFMLICSGLAFIGSLAWLALIAGELVEILSALGQMFSISPIFLGITVLAIGNSVVDAAANLGLAKQGKMVVAYSSIFSAPVAGSSLGFGIAVLLTTLTSTSVIKYELSPSIFLCWGAVVGSIILYCISIPFLFNYRPTNKFGFLLAGYYSLFLIAAIILEVLS